MGFYLLLKIWWKNLSNKYSQKILDTAKQFITDTIKTASKRAIRKTSEATGDLIGNKIADNNDKRKIPKERYISPEERQQIIDELRLV